MTIQSSDNPTKGWRLIHFNEFDDLKLTGQLVMNCAIKWRLGANPSPDEIQKAVQNSRDLRSAFKSDAEELLMQMMLEEAQKTFPKEDMDVPRHFDDVKRNWGRCWSVENAQVTWHILYGMFDELDMQSGRRGQLWQKRLEKLIMEK